MKNLLLSSSFGLLIAISAGMRRYLRPPLSPPLTFSPKPSPACCNLLYPCLSFQIIVAGRRVFRAFSLWFFVWSIG